MKINFLFFFLFSVLACSQVTDTIYINQFKTTQILFSDDITLVESGTGDLQVKTKIVDGNILIVQSVVPESDFIVTNLFIKTKGNIYNPMIGFSENPKISTYLEQNLKSAIGINPKTITLNSKQNTPKQNLVSNIKNSDLKNNAIVDKICEKKDLFKPSREYQTEVWFRFYAHYIQDGKYYFKFEIENNSALDYNIENIFFSVKNNKKRNASETQKEIPILQDLTEISVVPAKSKKCIIYTFSSFSIKRDEEFVVETSEKNGARNFQVGIPYFIINKPINL